MRIALVYDCLFPHTVGGAERWYRNLAGALVEAGHDVTYLTTRQWPSHEEPQAPAGVRVVPVAPERALYTDSGRRRILPPLAFGLGVMRHLWRERGRYDVVHTASFPYFSLLAAAALRRRSGFRLVVDWHEAWSAEYWRSYLGPIGGRVGMAVQWACMRVPQQAFCFSALTAARLRAGRVRGPVTTLRGLSELPGVPATTTAEPVVVFAGRHIPEKRPVAAIEGFAAALRKLPDLRLVIFGDGPERPAVLRAIAEHGLDDRVAAPGFVSSDEVESAMEGALCLVLPSSREGYGLVVLEAAARGVPGIVVAGPDNAAVELIVPGVNGFVCPTAAPEAIADAILRVWEGGDALREATVRWFEEHAGELSIESSLRNVLAAYGAPR